MSYDQLKLENQICFPLYASSRLITRLYQPLLEKVGLTYPQYLVLLVLWENDHRSVQEIGAKLILNTNTLTPLLKRMEILDLIERKKSSEDERSKIIALTEKGKTLEHLAQSIPEKLVESMSLTNVNPQDVTDLRDQLNGLVKILEEKVGR